MLISVDAEADSQQFILPVTVPLILSFILIQPIMENPDSSLAFWMSIFPLTSPIIMMVRIPFGVADWELLVSILVLIGSFILSTKFAAKIYRIGILMYGKKINYKDFGSGFDIRGKSIIFIKNRVFWLKHKKNIKFLNIFTCLNN